MARNKWLCALGLLIVVAAVSAATFFFTRAAPGNVDGTVECTNGNDCIGQQFEEQSLFTNLEKLEGVEEDEEGLFRSNYSVTFLETGIVGLAASENMIDRVTCTNGTVEIEFSMPVNSQRIESMFPESSVLAVDGIMFGECILTEDQDDFPSTADESLSATVGAFDVSGSGFLVVHSVNRSATNTVTIFGEGVSINYLFQERSITYEAYGDERGPGRKLSAFKVPSRLRDFTTKSFKAAVYFDPTITFDPGVVRDDWRLIGDRWWEFDPFVDFEILFNVELAMTLKLNLTVSGGLGIDAKDFPLLEFIPIPGFGFKLPRAVVKVLRKILPKIPIVRSIGAGFEMPFSFSLKTSTEIVTGVSSGFELSSGLSVYRWTLQGKPPNVLVDLEKVSDVPASANLFPLQYKLPDVKTGLEIKFGVKPTFPIHVFGLTSAYIQFFSGLKYSAQPFPVRVAPPIIDLPGRPDIINCAECHQVEHDFDVIAVGDPALAGFVFLKKRRDFSIKLSGLAFVEPFKKVCTKLREDLRCGYDKCCDSERCTVDLNGKGNCYIPPPPEFPDFGETDAPNSGNSPTTPRPSSTPLPTPPPTPAMTALPTRSPSESPSSSPSVTNTVSMSPTLSESNSPSLSPSTTPSSGPSMNPSTSHSPSMEPSESATPTQNVVHEEAFCFCEAWGGFVDSTDGVCKVKPKTERMEPNGHCLDESGNPYDYRLVLSFHTKSDVWTPESSCVGDCATEFGLNFLRGCDFERVSQNGFRIACLYDNNRSGADLKPSQTQNDTLSGTGIVLATDSTNGTECIRVLPADGDCDDRLGDKCYFGSMDAFGNCIYEKIQCSSDTEACDPLDGICKARPKFEQTGKFPFGTYGLPGRFGRLSTCSDPTYQTYAVLVISTNRKSTVEECLNMCLGHDNSFLVGASIVNYYSSSVCDCYFENGELPNVELGVNDREWEGTGGIGRPRCGGIHHTYLSDTGCFRFNRELLNTNAPLYELAKVPETADYNWTLWVDRGRPRHNP